MRFCFLDSRLFCSKSIFCCLKRQKDYLILVCTISLLFRILLRYSPMAKYINRGIAPDIGEISKVLSSGITANPSEMSGLRASSIVCIKITNKSERERKKTSVYIIVQMPIVTKPYTNSHTSP